MQKVAKENIIVVCTVVLCFMLTIALCASFTGKGILGAFSLEKREDKTVFAVCTGGYEDMTLARTTADLIKGRGGAGYIFSGDSIEIIYAVYPDEDSAKKVLAGLGENGAYIKEISIKAVSLKWAKGEVKDAVQAALGYYELAFASLYKTANSLADGTMSAEDAKTQIRVLYAQIEDLKSDLYQKTVDEDGEELTNIKLALITALALLDNIKTSGSVAQITSSVRYALVQLVYCRQALK